MARGELRVYLGAAPGVGKTYQMLGEGQRRRARGADVVVGFVETYARAGTQAMLDGLETVARRRMPYRGATFDEMDLAAVLSRHPDVVLVDELAHTNVAGSRNAKRWQDIEELLASGVTVLTTLNIQHLESLNDVVEQITGAVQRETVPDEVVRGAEQVELVDLTAEALRRRMSHGNIYPAERIDAALGNYFRVGNLTALRELALLWLADKVDDQLDRYRAVHHLDATEPARERVVVALTGGGEGAALIRRAARIAARTSGADLLAVHVARSDGLASAGHDGPAQLARQRSLVESLGGTYHQVVGDDVARALLDFARGVAATQLVLGASRRGRLAQILSRGVGLATTVQSGPIDVHLVSHEESGRGQHKARTRTTPLSRRRWWVGVMVGLLGLCVLAVLYAVRGQMSFATGVLLIFAAVVGVALVKLATRRGRQAARAGADARNLAILAGTRLNSAFPVTDVLERLRDTFQVDDATLLERRPGVPRLPRDRRDQAVWRIVANVGEHPCRTPDEGDVDVSISGEAQEEGESEAETCLVLRGRALAATDQRIVEAFAAQATLALRQERLVAAITAAAPIEEAARKRTARLIAATHDIGSEIASAKAAITSFSSLDVRFSHRDRDELVSTAQESLHRLDTQLANLLDSDQPTASHRQVRPGRHTAPGHRE